MMSASSEIEGPRFACDAMCGGLARWLRALGYDARFWASIDDGELVRLAQHEGRIVISSDSRLFERRLIRDGTVAAVFLPRGLKRLDQVRFTVSRLGLRVREPRCMSCGGELRAAAAEEVGDRVPARSLIWATRFFECRACGRVLWNGSHWRRIEAVRAAAPVWAEPARLGIEAPDC